MEYRESSFYANSIYVVSLIRDLLQRSIFIQVAVLQGGVPKMGDRSFICVLILKVIAVLHTCIHTKTAEFHWKKVSIYAISVYVFRNASIA
jgi:hypothetical protein